MNLYILGVLIMSGSLSWPDQIDKFFDVYWDLHQRFILANVTEEKLDKSKDLNRDGDSRKAVLIRRMKIILEDVEEVIENMEVLIDEFDRDKINDLTTEQLAGLKSRDLMYKTMENYKPLLLMCLLAEQRKCL